MNIAVFAYNFPHKKTQDFLFRLLLENIDVKCVLASDFVELNLTESILRVKPRHIDLVHPQRICERFNIPYYNVMHNSEECEELLNKYDIDLGIIAGARILKQNIIESVKIGIINFHPGILPEVRGLDALKWAIYNDLPIGVTAHLIDSKIDAGRIIMKKEVPIYKDDTLIDVSLRLHEFQVNLLPQVIKEVESKPKEMFQKVDISLPYNRKMEADKEMILLEKWNERLNRI
ncbi:formyltransferase family protein [Defluviitalea raffinosedens]|uniref:phosphoribosylglycinamide formyltransferase 1 n=1 Tax=Defluviitalea raffinosedens TaxID=1450156 RepID=A0A7C8HFG6_9FIRM|nr:formyltransferase family protein [Defluviitalea raffinosedens]KAE9635594.1 hypothetical protein GND95_05465 [Defluviitalea raffinosedens]MBM7684511.1 phosphoribosylglycinamide formyltransferase-1 [Defluviitalea raffinosedens]HHW68385.1 hypothetical protein [Candidatus Epulonipiscium sp.]